MAPAERCQWTSKGVVFSTRVVPARSFRARRRLSISLFFHFLFDFPSTFPNLFCENQGKHAHLRFPRFCFCLRTNLSLSNRPDRLNHGRQDGNVRLDMFCVERVCANVLKHFPQRWKVSACDVSQCLSPCVTLTVN